jgi:hypothetical protein
MTVRPISYSVSTFTRFVVIGGLEAELEPQQVYHCARGQGLSEPKM